MQKNARLEILSDKIRRGEPISFGDAMEVVEYQQTLKRYRDSMRKGLLQKILDFFRR